MESSDLVVLKNQFLSEFFSFEWLNTFVNVWYMGLFISLLSVKKPLLVFLEFLIKMHEIPRYNNKTWEVLRF